MSGTLVRNLGESVACGYDAQGMLTSIETSCLNWDSIEGGTWDGSLAIPTRITGNPVIFQLVCRFAMHSLSTFVSGGSKIDS
jgi:hypothetical protein